MFPAEDSLCWDLCNTPEDVSCDGLGHYWAVWDEDTNRSYPVDGHCPHRAHNSQIKSYDKLRDWGHSHEEACAIAGF
jgi:hypothetical protein